MAIPETCPPAALSLRSASTQGNPAPLALTAGLHRSRVAASTSRAAIVKPLARPRNCRRTYRRWCHGKPPERAPINLRAASTSPFRALHASGRVLVGFSSNS